MHIFLFSYSKQVNQEIHLHQRFAACDGDAAAVIKRLISFILFKNIFWLHQCTAVHFPCVGVVAVSAPHRAPLYKHHKPGSRSVYCAKTF